MVVNSDGADGVDGVDGSVSGGVIPWQNGRLLQSSVYRVLSLISFLLRPPISVSGGGLSQDKVLLSCAREREREGGPGNGPDLGRGRRCLGFNHQLRPLTVRWALDTARSQVSQTSR